MPVPVFLEWEIIFSDDYLKNGYDKFINISNFWDICIRYKVRITVNRMRKICGVGPHPDYLDPSRLRDRGTLYVFEDNPGDEQNDSIIPPGIAKAFWDQKILAYGSKEAGGTMESGGLSLEQIKLKFPELANLVGV